MNKHATPTPDRDNNAVFNDLMRIAAQVAPDIQDACDDVPLPACVFALTDVLLAVLAQMDENMRYRFVADIVHAVSDFSLNGDA